MSLVRSMPLVSVCIPVYNTVKFVEEAIRSVLAQNYPNIEILVQDNASTDGTWELLQSLAGMHPELQLERNETNIGGPNNWNKVFNRAHGDFLMLLSADDLLEPNYLSRTLEVFHTFKVDVVTTNYFFLEGAAKRLRPKALPGGVYENFQCGLLHSPMMFNINSTMFRREAANKLRVKGNLMAIKLMSIDYDLWFRMALQGLKVYYLPEPLLSYRLHEANDSKNKRKLRRHTIMVLLRHRTSLIKSCGISYKQMLFRHLVKLLRPKTYDRRLCQALFGELWR